MAFFLSPALFLLVSQRLREQREQDQHEDARPLCMLYRQKNRQSSKED
jgi:hypothetical protein